MRRRRKPASHQPNFDRDGGVDWRSHERDAAKRSGARLTPGSGNKPGRPGDVVDFKFMRECKATAGASITIRADWLRKLVPDSLSRGMIPLVEVRLGGQTPPVPTDWVLIPADDFEALVNG